MAWRGYVERIIPWEAENGQAGMFNRFTCEVWHAERGEAERDALALIEAQRLVPMDWQVRVEQEASR